MKLPRRNEHTHWMNEHPITDILEALEVLLKGWNEQEKYISLEYGELEIHLEWYREGDSGGDRSGTDYLQIDPELYKKLRQERLVKQREIKHFGYTEVRDTEFVLSRWGMYELKRMKEEVQKAVRSKLEPGVHSKWSGIFNSIGDGRDRGRWGGRLYFDFETPIGEKVRVYADNGEFTMLAGERDRSVQRAGA